ncbi:hypothetical protein CCACVL1_27335 [Corchorus capsularis]|uniref:Myb-like domain-containing protein n=1 Tax=Corchorus capsularis TaxID=210143 RepID=A0A1R3GAX7_COCAP|nr:hypothetical protein CCACVL1_27335 [Corchorus capsularis]
MLGGGDTTASVLGSSSGVVGGGGGAAASTADVSAAASSGARDGSSEVAANMLGGPNGNNNHNLGEDDRSRVDEGDRSFGGNRWPRQETLALLKIRSDMDVTFRDASVKGPLWEEVSRKLAELGYHRSAKKCKEKFENVYKYHKRTKTGKSDGKTYRFFDQLEAFGIGSHPPPPPLQSPAAPPPQLKPQTTMPAAATNNNNNNPQSLPPHVSTVPSTTTTLPSLPQNIVPPNINITVPSFPSTNPTIQPPPPPTLTNPTTFPNISADLMSNYSTSSSTSSDLELEGRRKRKRKWKDFFERLMKEVIQKQEDMQKKFLEAIEKREHERLVREEAWRMQEMARINREREILAQERSIAAAKDAAVMAFLQKISEQQNPGQAPQNNTNPNPILPSQQPQLKPQAAAPQAAPPPPPPQPVSAVAPPAAPPATAAAAPVQAPAPPPLVAHQQMMNMEVSKTDNGDQSYTPPSSSRWPKVEVEALIKLRTNLDSKYQENGPKGPLWEEISAAMKKLGYNRNSKRCKEKWENINKYFKKVKESNKKRPEDSKTCPYFHQLDAIYKERNKFDQLKPENSVPLMVRPEQQWPPPPSEPHQHDHHHDHVMEDMESDQNQDEDDKDGDDEEEDDEGGDYEIVASKPVSMGGGE